jgi:3',5'-cyclic-nucleotide phosphodiesterase
VICEVIVRQGKSRGRRFRVEKGEKLSIGRGMKADVQLFDEGLSRVHCEIENTGDVVRVRDLESSNGTYVNGEPVASADVHDGDEVRLGLAILEIRGPERPKKNGAGKSTTSLTIIEDADEAVKAEESYGPRGTEFMRKVDPAQAEMLKAEGEANLDRIRRAHRDLATIYRIGNAINAIREPRELADTVAEMLLDVTESDRAVVLLGDGRVQKPEPVASRERGHEGPVDELSVSRTVLDDVVRKGASVLSRDVPGDSRFAAGESLVMQRVKSMMCAPLLAQGEVIGAIYVDSRASKEAFDEQDLELLAAIGNQAGVAIQRAKLVTELEDLFFSSMRSLVTAVDAKDGYTHGHAERVTAFALKLAKELAEKLRGLYVPGPDFLCFCL